MANSPEEQALENYEKIKQLLRSSPFPEDMNSSTDIPEPGTGCWKWRCQCESDSTTAIQ